jgi:iron complex outermembrane recepter protein
MKHLPLSRASRRSNFELRPCAQAAAVLLAMFASASALAQASDPAKLERVEITGSSIKRADAETALPVQIIKREDIDKSGASTAAEIVKSISANTAPLGDGASITDGTSGQRGFNGANLRGLGVSSTLVLLNGRRLANFATPGDNAGVDLNNIPAGAIQRVEVLKDGASAIYGTDAIGGVINFITRKDYQGFDINTSLAATQEGGAGKRTLSLSGGYGDINADGFNFFGVLDLQRLDSLRSSQRQFIQDRPLASTLPSLMSSRPFPANVRIRSADQWAALQRAGLVGANEPYVRSVLVNPSAPNCNPPASVYAPNSYGGKFGCSYDYMRDTEIYPESGKNSFLGRATLQAAPNHQVFAELMQSVATSTYRYSANPITINSFPVSTMPLAYRNALTGAGLPTTVNRLQLRMAEAGNRTNEVTSTGQRFVLGANGLVGGWDYDVALSRAENRSVDKYVDGYVLFDKYQAGLFNGTINAFGPSGQAGIDLINSIKINDEARTSRGTTIGIDGKISKALTTLAGGDLALALGAETRRENSVFTPSALLTSNNIAGDRDSVNAPGASSTDLKPTDDSRQVTSLFAEINAPITKQLELQFALRHDRYSDVGSTTNPKFGVRWQPEKSFLMRASAGSGFRAPSLYELYGPITFGTTSSVLTDPDCVKGGDTIDFCTTQWPVERRSNPNLRPEKSQQFSFGAVLEATKNLSFSVDYWNIRKTDVISTLGEQVIVGNPTAYNGTYIQRDSAGAITNIILKKENQGALNTSGLDLGADFRTQVDGAGRFSVSLNGTLVLNYDRQFGPLEPTRSNVGQFLNDQVVQKWRHRLTFGWDQGPFSVTLANQYSSGYTDQNTTYDPVTNKLLAPREVEAYSLWDITGSYAVNKQLKVRAGLLNVLNTAPPFSNQAYYFLSTYDPTYTDPRGRSGFVSLNYSFK